MPAWVLDRQHRHLGRFLDRAANPWNLSIDPKGQTDAAKATFRRVGRSDRSRLACVDGGGSSIHRRRSDRHVQRHM